MNPISRSLIFLVSVCVFSIFASPAEERSVSKTIATTLECPSQNPGCKDEHCRFENDIQLITDGKIISKVTVKWRKTATSQCCIPDRDALPGGRITLTYSDGSTQQVTANNHWASGLAYLNPGGQEVLPGTGALPDPPPQNPSGLTFDTARSANGGLKSISIDYPMRLSCRCENKPPATNTTEWKTSMSFNAGDTKIKARTEE